MAAPEQPTLGQVAFTAYREHRGGVNHDGSPTPTWEQLPAEIQEAWTVAGQAAFHAYHEDEARWVPELAR